MNTKKRDTSAGLSRNIMEQAQEGNALMQYQLASYLYVGDAQKAPDKEKGFRWMQASAENGCIKAQKILGLLYTNGQHAPWPERDLEQAVYWYGRAAQSGDGEAMYWLSCCYRKGIGVVYDEAAADYWQEQAGLYGYEIEEEPESETDEQAETVAAEEAKETAEQPWEQYDLNEEPSVRKKRSEIRKQNKKKKIQEKSLDIAQEGVIFTPKYDIEYVKSAAVYGAIAVSVGVIICCILAVVINVFSPGFFETSKRGAFLVISGLISVGMGAFAFRNGYISAYEETKKCAWFRNTPFYHQFQIDYDQLTEEELLNYDYYCALEKSFKPCAYKDLIPKSAFREFRGYLFMGLYFGEKGASARPDFMVITEKSVYVITCEHFEGRLRGDVTETEWQLTLPNGSVRKVANPVLQNERRIQLIKKECSNICPWAVTDIVPFYSMILFGPGADLRGITGPRKEERTHVLQMSGEELRGYIEVIESKNSLLEEETIELTKAIEQIAGEYETRRSAIGREVY